MISLSGITNLCYTVIMDINHHIWRVWIQHLHRWGLQDWVASVLETAGSLTIVGAQLIYIFQPVMAPVVPKTHLDTLAEMLEDKSQVTDFITCLREGATW